MSLLNPSSTASTSGDTTAVPKKRRGRLACQRCHNRRVRCDASVKGPPCSHCTASDLADSCRLIESRKVRGERGRFSSRAVLTPSEVSTAVNISSDLVTRGVQKQYVQEPAHDQVNCTTDTIPTEDTTTPDSHRPQPSQPPHTGTPFEADQWTKIVTRDAAPVPESGRITYLGESWNLSYFLQWKSHTGAVANGANAAALDNASPSSQSDGHSPSLHIPVPPSKSRSHDILSATAPRPYAHASRTSSSVEGQLSQPVKRALLDAYCRHHLTLYPVMSETNLRADFDANTISPLLLAAVLYAGAIHAPEPIIYRAGFESRQACLRKLYLRAKSLFFEEDEEDEEGSASSNDKDNDPLARVQAAFLLHHMWFRPNSTMDCWTWLGLAVRLAQNMGMHRSTARSSLRDDDRKLWKRMWWSLYSRDSQLASGVGKPLIINDLDCDVEPLSMDDFEDHHGQEVRLFAIHQARLADVCKQVMSSRFVPRCAAQPLDNEQKAKLINDLEAWKATLPGSLMYHPNQDPESTPFEALLLETVYNNMILLIHRPQFLPNNQAASIENDAPSWKIVFHAAGVITRVTNIIMNYKSIYHCPIFYTSALFGAMLMHAIRGPSAEHQLSLCMIAMRSLATMYSNAEWVRNIFQALDRKKQTAVYPSVSTCGSSPHPAFQEDNSTLPTTTSLSIHPRRDEWPTPTTTARLSGDSSEHIGATVQQLWPLHEGHDRIRGENTLFPPLVGHTPTENALPPDAMHIDPFNFSHLHPDLECYWEDFVRSENLFTNQYILDRLSGG